MGPEPVKAGPGVQGGASKGQAVFSVEGELGCPWQKALGAAMCRDSEGSILDWCFSFWLTSLCIIGSSFIHEDLMEKGMVTHSNSLAWRIPWTEEPESLQSIGSHGVRHD